MTTEAVRLEEDMILADTNAWIRHFRATDMRLVVFLKEQRARTCDVVIGELLLGSGLPKGVSRDQGRASVRGLCRKLGVVAP